MLSVMNRRMQLTRYRQFRSRLRCQKLFTIKDNLSDIKLQNVLGNSLTYYVSYVGCASGLSSCGCHSLRM